VGGFCRARITIPDITDEQARVLHNLPQVEFDDTGFVGREKELSELRRAILGSYPVVTVVGEGGLGKTALALKACYDLLDDDEANLDAIVWTTAKATKLTLSEIQSIEGSISTSLGIIESATALLGRQNESSAIEDLLMHLQNNRILLVIDNLETVIDNNIRNLVRQLPQGSKILFTTRIGLGAFDFPIPLSPLDKKEAAFYFRRTAKVFGVLDLAMATNQIVDGFCSKLQNNPLFIKWFVQSVRAGKRPSVLTNDPTILLQFCLQNVFNSLSPESRIVASTLASVSGPQSVASIAFFTDLDSLSIQSALSVLITSNLISAERGRSSEDEDRYTLSPLARMYIQKFIRPNLEEQKKLIKKQNELRSAQEEYSAKAGTDVVDMSNVFSQLNESELPPNRGKLVHKSATFAFIETGGARFFFHRNSWLGKQDFASTQEGAILEFGLGKNAKGVCAINVRPISDVEEREDSNEPILGAVISLFANHGFLELDRGGTIFFHSDTCMPATKFKSLAVGDRVRFSIGRNADGKRRAVNVELYSGV
jgi:cold shock CspA family protein/AAA+ ATPase superfamily predicted ATPase